MCPETPLEAAAEIYKRTVRTHQNVAALFTDLDFVIPSAHSHPINEKMPIPRTTTRIQAEFLNLQPFVFWAIRQSIPSRCKPGLLEVDHERVLHRDTLRHVLEGSYLGQNNDVVIINGPIGNRVFVRTTRGPSKETATLKTFQAKPTDPSPGRQGGSRGYEYQTTAPTARAQDVGRPRSAGGHGHGAGLPASSQREGDELRPRSGRMPASGEDASVQDSSGRRPDGLPTAPRGGVDAGTDRSAVEEPHLDPAPTSVSDGPRSHGQ